MPVSVILELAFFTQKARQEDLIDFVCALNVFD